MSTLKARFDLEEAEHLLRGLYPDVRGLTAIAGGEASRAYAFTAGTARLVLRVNHQFSYQIDAWASRKMAPASIPAPQVLQLGQAGRHHWAVSEMAPGTMLSKLAPSEIEPVMAELVRTLIDIHETPVMDSTGYGHIGESGNAGQASWHEFLTGDGKYGSFVDWDSALLQAEREQRSLIERAWKIAGTLVESCSEARVFNHGDFSQDNILADGRGISGVVDWSNCLYGDPVWDVAWADFWTPEPRFAPAYFRVKPTDDGELRLLCYQLLIAAQSLGFYLHTGQPDKGQWLAERLRLLLGQATAFPHR